MMPKKSPWSDWMNWRGWKVSRRDWLFCGLTALAGCSPFVGCQQLDVNSQSPEDELDEIEINVKAVSDFAKAYGLHASKVEGVALVTQLPGTGGDPPPTPMRTALIDDMQARGVEHPNQILQSPNTAMVLVIGYMRPGIRKGDHFDIKVQSPPNDPTTSLRGGFLMETRLTELALVGDRLRSGRLNALAAGPVLIDPTAEATADDKQMLVRGLIPGGGMATRDRDLGLTLRDVDAPLAKRVHIADSIGKAINLRFQVYEAGVQIGVAKPHNDQFIELKIVERYKNNLARYMAVVRAIAIRETASERVKRLKLLERQLLDPVTSAHASIGLEAIGQDGVAILKKGMASTNPEVRFYSAEALAYLDVTEAAPALARAAEEEAAFRVYALTALSAMGDIAAYEELRKLLHVPSAETRYGAFRALWTAHRDDPFVRGENIGKNPFAIHTIDSSAQPMVHVTTSFRPEVVLFGNRQRIQSPVLIEIGKSLSVHARSPEDVVVSNFGTNDAPRKIVSDDLEQIIRAIAGVGGDYGDVVQFLQIAKKKGVLSSRLEVDALPQVGRTYHRGRPGADAAAESSEENENSLKVNSPTPELFEAPSEKPRRKSSATALDKAGQDKGADGEKQTANSAAENGLKS